MEMASTAVSASTTGVETSMIDKKLKHFENEIEAQKRRGRERHSKTKANLSALYELLIKEETEDLEQVDEKPVVI